MSGDGAETLSRDVRPVYNSRPGSVPVISPFVTVPGLPATQARPVDLCMAEEPFAEALCGFMQHTAHNILYQRQPRDTSSGQLLTGDEKSDFFTTKKLRRGFNKFFPSYFLDRKPEHQKVEYTGVLNNHGLQFPPLPRCTLPATSTGAVSSESEEDANDVAVDGDDAGGADNAGGLHELVFRQEDGSPRVRVPTGILDSALFTPGSSSGLGAPGQVPDCGIFDGLNIAGDTTPQEAELLLKLSNTIVSANPEAMAQLASFFERKRQSVRVGSSVRRGLADAARVPAGSLPGSPSLPSAFRVPAPPSSIPSSTVPRRNTSTKLPVVPRVPRRSPPSSTSSVLLKAHCVVRASADLLRGGRSSSLKRKSAGGESIAKRVRVNSVDALARASREVPITIVVSTESQNSSVDGASSAVSLSSSTKSNDRTMAQTTVTSSLSSPQVAAGLAKSNSTLRVPSPLAPESVIRTVTAPNLAAVSGTIVALSSVVSTTEVSSASYVIPVSSAATSVTRGPSTDVDACLTPQDRVEYLKAHLCENVAKCVPGDANVIRNALAACEMWGVSCIALSDLVTRLRPEDAADMYIGALARYTVKTSSTMMHARLNRRHPEFVDPVTERYLRVLFRYLFVTYPAAVGDLQIFPEPHEAPDTVPVPVGTSVVTSSSRTATAGVTGASTSPTMGVSQSPLSSSSATAVSGSLIVIPESSHHSASTISAPVVQFPNRVVSAGAEVPLTGLFSLARTEASSVDTTYVASGRKPASNIIESGQKEPGPQTSMLAPSTSTSSEVASAGGTPEGTLLDDFIDDSEDSGEYSTSVSTSYVVSEATDETWRPRHIVESADDSPHVLRIRDPVPITTRRRRTKPVVLQVGGSSVLGRV